MTQYKYQQVICCNTLAVKGSESICLTLKIVCSNKTAILAGVARCKCDNTLSLLCWLVEWHWTSQSYADSKMAHLWSITATKDDIPFLGLNIKVIGSWSVIIVKSCKYMAPMSQFDSLLAN